MTILPEAYDTTNGLLNVLYCVRSSHLFGSHSPIFLTVGPKSLTVPPIESSITIGDNPNIPTIATVRLSPLSIDWATLIHVELEQFSPDVAVAKLLFDSPITKPLYISDLAVRFVKRSGVCRNIPADIAYSSRKWLPVKMKISAASDANITTYDAGFYYVTESCGPPLTLELKLKSISFAATSVFPSLSLTISKQLLSLDRGPLPPWARFPQIDAIQLETKASSVFLSPNYIPILD
jgi:hypothetical protein